MAVTGDWTMVEGTDNNNGPSQEEPMQTTETTAPAAAVAAPNVSQPSQKSKAKAAVRFPCMEQPPRYALRSAKTGHYLGGTKRGKLVGRTKRNEHDEWTIALVDNGGSANNNNNNNGSSNNNNNNNNSSIATIHNYKHGNILSMVLTDSNDLGRMAACVKPPQQLTSTENDYDLGLGEEATEAEAEAATTPQEQVPNDEDDDDTMVIPTTTAAANTEDMQWCVIRCNSSSDDEQHNNNPNNTGGGSGGVMIVSMKTGDCLSVTDQGQIVLSPYEPFHVWEMECVTGELCFLSNPSIDARVRCDMAGILTLSPNWKGWEVIRITEVAAAHSNSSSDNDHQGYVRISSWMHSQWFLCSDASGTVGTCSVSEALLGPGVGTHDIDDSEYRCSKWAIEKYNPTNEHSNEHNNKHQQGLIFRSVTHGRLLSIQDGLLRTYDDNSRLDDNDKLRQANNDGRQDDEFVNTDTGTTTNNTSTSTNSAVSTTLQGDGGAAIGDLVKHHTDEMKRKTEEMKRKGSNWWKQSLTNVQKTISDSAIQRRNSKLATANGEMMSSSSSKTGLPIPVEETIVWQLEAAHLQTYYFLSSQVAPQASSGDEEENSNNLNSISNSNSNANQPPRSIGAFPTLTENLRKSDKIQLIRNDDSPDTLKLYLPDEHFYIKCSSKGSILATKQEQDEGTEWIMEEHETGSVFRSKAHGLYLSFREEDLKTPPASAFGASNPEAGETETETATSSSPRNDNNHNNNKLKKMNPFEHLKLLQKRKPRIAELCATETSNSNAVVWNLEPCTPRAISSKRLKTFAIGTSIAVGTTIAMPFAIAGVAAAMGALGAEAGIGFGIVAAAATGAEAIASVGAIGATAYFCFKPEQNSLGDDLDDDDDEGSSTSPTTNPWSKRPFANWRNW